MTRRLLLLLTIGLAVTLAASGVVASTTIQTACSGSGFSGSRTEAGTTITFESCAITGGVHTIVWDSSNNVMTESTYLEDPEDLTFEIDGIEITEEGGYSTAEKEDMEEVLTSVDADVLRGLWADLISLGVDPDSDGMVSLAGVLTAYENEGGEGPGTDSFCDDCKQPSTECFGCCGSGCSGCRGICTDACEYHDECVRENGQFACFGLLFNAVVS